VIVDEMTHRQDLVELVAAMSQNATTVWRKTWSF
jgi:hypothetical protein